MRHSPTLDLTAVASQGPRLQVGMGDRADLRRDRHDDAHQQGDEQCDPGELVGGARADGHRGADVGGVVVRGALDDLGTDAAQETGGRPLPSALQRLNATAHQKCVAEVGLGKGEAGVDLAGGVQDLSYADCGSRRSQGWPR